MAYDIVIPPWLHGPRESLAETYLQAYATGNRIAQTQIDRQMQAEQQAAQLDQERQLRQQQIDKEAMLAMTRLRVEQAHDNAMAEIEKQKAKATMDRAKIAVDAAARQAAARRQYEIDKAGGMNAMEALIKNPEAFGPSVFSGALRTQQGVRDYGKPLLMDIPGGGKIAYRPGSAEIHTFNAPDAAVKSDLTKKLNAARTKLAGVQAKINLRGEKAWTADKEELSQRAAEVKELERMLQELTPALPAPPSATEQYQPGQMNPYPPPLPIPQAAPLPQAVPQAVPQVLPQPVPQPARPRAGFKIGKYDVLVE